MEKRVFTVTNLVTKDFAHVGGVYIVELQAEIGKLVHDTEVKAALEAKILESEGVALLNNALHYIETTAAKVLHHTT